MALQAIDFSVRDTVKEVIAEFQGLQSTIPHKAMVRAANTAATRVRTESGREIRKIYNLKLRAIRAASFIKRASPRQSIVRSSVIWSGRPIPLIEFAARAVNAWNLPGKRHKRRGGGVSVRIKRNEGRKTVSGAFIAQTSRMSSPGVFRRTGEARYPIKQLRSISIPTTITNRAVLNALNEVGHTKFRDEFVRQINLALARKG